MILFPQKLHKVLDEGKYERIISWQPHGRSFKVHKGDEFTKSVLPLFAKTGPDKGSYYHPHFILGCFDLCKQDYMSRKQSVLDHKKCFQDGIGNLFDVNKGFSPLPSTVENIIPILNSRGSSSSNDLSGTASLAGWVGNTKDPREFVPRLHSARGGATYRHNHYESQLQNHENLTLPSLLEREMHPRDFQFSQIAPRNRGYYNNPQGAQVSSHPPSRTIERNTYNPFQVQPKSYDGEEPKGISCNHNHYYEERRQDYGQDL
ncbi:hypothetical protein CTEN210_12710 [Chaetoceros tenuissimus]|uniref:HSF-type DNA-binding domain-containing protein n=1 Tax=Chaetoceros tenuissimus TaxID=426638 RepID=A0AAD3D556_9STRA|nr:hypothetical protein CTEN210_12710 [Chaetoceros tenuissimus]